MLQEIKAETFIVRLLCDHCQCEMTRSNVVLTSDPAEYQYNCPRCQLAQTESVSYPQTIVREVYD